jgi:quinoprotein glucose dehydrogenase
MRRDGSVGFETAPLSKEATVRLTITLVCVWTVALLAQGQPAAPPTRSIRDGVYTIEQADRGKRFYTSYCAECHMSDLRGKVAPPVRVATDAPGNYLLRYPPGTSPALAGVQFVANWTDLRLGDLFTRVRVSMPQMAPGSLSRQQNADIVAYLLNANGYPAGVSELPTVQTSLDDIRIEK